MFRIAALIIAGAIIASPTHAQVVYSNEARGEIIGCATMTCVRAVEAARMDEVYPNPNNSNVRQCVTANNDLGKWINQSSRYITVKYNNGDMNYDTASDIRNLFYSETYVLRNILRDIIRHGDVEACNRLKNQAILVVNDILRSSMGYSGAVRTEGPYYGSSN